QESYRPKIIVGSEIGGMMIPINDEEYIDQCSCCDEDDDREE
ncbi:hypothetical protein LCGC14_2606980, partial [marine sediment metagenome]